MEAMAEEKIDNIFLVSGSSKFNLLNEDDPTYVVPGLETCYLDDKAIIGPLYLIDYKVKKKMRLL